MSFPIHKHLTKIQQSYIIISKCSFQPSFGANQRSHKPMASARQQFCGDTMNIFGREDHNFKWSRAYSYYSTPAAENQVIWTSGIARAGCVPEVFYCKDLVSWCADKFILDTIIISLRDRSSVSLSP
jgi:hypothetical protein